MIYDKTQVSFIKYEIIISKYFIYLQKIQRYDD